MKKTSQVSKLAGGLAALVARSAPAGRSRPPSSRPSERSDAIVADAAEQLGVEASELDAALNKALQNQVDAAVEAGALTEEQGEELKERIAAGDMPLVGLGPGGPGGHGHHVFDLSVAAEYLGVTENELRDRPARGRADAGEGGRGGGQVRGRPRRGTRRRRARAARPGRRRREADRGAAGRAARRARGAAPGGRRERSAGAPRLPRRRRPLRRRPPPTAPTA